jgi:hypothetical protein
MPVTQMRPSIEFSERLATIAALSLLMMGSVSCTRGASGADKPSDGVAATTSPSPQASNGPAIPRPDAAAAPLRIPPAVENACAAICERSKGLHCKHADECAANCVVMGMLSICGQQVDAFYKCLMLQPVKNWECDEDGVAAIREGFCDAEQEQAVKCVTTSAQR